MLAVSNYDHRMNKLKVILLIVILWLIVSSLYAYYYVVSILALPEEYDAYARNWQFQLLMFAIFRLPLLALALTLLIALAVRLMKRKKGPRFKSEVSE